MVRVERERESWEKAPRGWRVGLTGGVGGETWRPDSARITRIGDALADRPRVRRGLSAGRGDAAVNSMCPR